MRSIGSVLERRISNSPFAGLSDAVHINLYREGVVLHFEAGKLARVEAVPGSQWEPISLPPLLFAPLVLGWRSADQLSDIYPDVGIVAERKPLVDVLFPRMESWIHGTVKSPGLTVRGAWRVALSLPIIAPAPGPSTAQNAGIPLDVTFIAPVHTL
jgi:hypothetical protein